MNKWVIYWLDVFAVQTPTLNIIRKQIKWSQTERWVLDRSGRRQLRSCSYNCTVWHTYPGNFREGSKQHAVINQCLNPRQVNGEEEKNECEDREREEQKRWKEILWREIQSQRAGDTVGARRGFALQTASVSCQTSFSSPPSVLLFKSIYSGTISPLWTLHS